MRGTARILGFVLPLVLGPGLAPAAWGQIPQGDITIGLELIAEGLTSPVYATHAGDASGRLFVVDQIGQIRIIDADGTLPSVRPSQSLSMPSRHRGSLRREAIS